MRQILFFAVNKIIGYDVQFDFNHIMKVLHKKLAVAQPVVRFEVLHALRAVKHNLPPIMSLCRNKFWGQSNHFILMLVHMQHQQSSTRTPLGKNNVEHCQIFAISFHI
jgi:hypothetical protein